MYTYIYVYIYIYACTNSGLAFYSLVRFVESEVRMFGSMRKGTFVMHHLEPSYFAAMRRALDKHLESEWAEELGEK